MKRHIAILPILSVVSLLAATPFASAQNGAAPKQNDATGSQAQPSASSQQQRTSPPTLSNNPADQAGANTGSGGGTRTMPVQQGATTGGQPAPEIPRSDSAR